MDSDPDRHEAEAAVRAGAAYADLVAETLAEERARKSSIEQRGAHVITSSAAIAGALVGLSVLTRPFSTGSVPPCAVWLLGLGIGGLGLAAVLALITTWPLSYDEVDDAELQRLIEPQYWDAVGSIGERRAAEVRVSVIARARIQNGRKTMVLTSAMGLQIVALTLMVAGAAIAATR